MNARSVHKTIITALKAKAGTANAGQSSDSYTGSGHAFYAVSVPDRRAILKEVVKANKKEATIEGWLRLVDALMAGKSHEEKTMGAYLLGYVPEARKTADFSRLDTWLEELEGWAEVDSLCQNIFQPDELLVDWSGWQKFLRKLAKDKNINKRRASLVFLTGPTWKSDDKRLHVQAYENIDRLKHEKDILITKAISWLLRSMVDTRPKEVAGYLLANADTLPKIVLRETKRKLATGKKNK